MAARNRSVYFPHAYRAVIEPAASRIASAPRSVVHRCGHRRGDRGFRDRDGDVERVGTVELAVDRRVGEHPGGAVGERFERGKAEGLGRGDVDDRARRTRYAAASSSSST